MKISQVLPAAAAALLLTVASAPVAAETSNAIPGNVTLVRGGAHAILVWNASPVVASVTSAKTPHEQALAQLESDALSLAAAHAVRLPAAQDITVRVVYLKMGAVDPAYGAPTLTDVETLFTLQAPRGDIVSQEAAWAAQLNARKVPQGITVSVTGELPPV